jgi:hypothetical protein
LAKQERAIQELKREQLRLRNHLIRGQESGLDQFYWICIERKGTPDFNQKTCTYVDRQIIRRFEYLEPVEVVEPDERTE